MGSEASAPAAYQSDRVHPFSSLKQAPVAVIGERNIGVNADQARSQLEINTCAALARGQYTTARNNVPEHTSQPRGKVQDSSSNNVELPCHSSRYHRGRFLHRVVDIDEKRRSRLELSHTACEARQRCPGRGVGPRAKYPKSIDPSSRGISAKARMMKRAVLLDARGERRADIAALPHSHRRSAGCPPPSATRAAHRRSHIRRRPQQHCPVDRPPRKVTEVTGRRLRLAPRRAL